MASQAWTVVGSGDYNADGRSDILWRNTDDRREHDLALGQFGERAKPWPPSLP
jgi:hypothetical protein